MFCSVTFEASNKKRPVVSFGRGSIQIGSVVEGGPLRRGMLFLKEIPEGAVGREVPPFDPETNLPDVVAEFVNTQGLDVLLEKLQFLRRHLAVHERYSVAANNERKRWDFTPLADGDTAYTVAYSEAECEKDAVEAVAKNITAREEKRDI